MPEHDRVVQCCRLVHAATAEGDIRAVVEQTFNDRLVACDNREVKRRPAHLIPDPGLGAVGEQHRYAGYKPVEDGRVERCVALSVGGVDVSADGGEIRQ